jgi:bifunctional N-acetylglucosamine-1-phosphate-uridyltransferase/glucosamine-1-phosphate-acetyltransferase GlmU-like protein
MSSFIENTNIDNDNIIGPFAYLRENTNIKKIVLLEHMLKLHEV